MRGTGDCGVTVSIQISLEGENKVGKTSDHPRLAEVCQCKVWMLAIFVSSKASHVTFRGVS